MQWHTTWDESDVMRLNHQGNQNTTLHEDLSFVLPAVLLYTFLRCFTMYDIITKRPDKL